MQRAVRGRGLVLHFIPNDGGRKMWGESICVSSVIGGGTSLHVGIGYVGSAKSSQLCLKDS